jgi:hypothetical protein
MRACKSILSKRGITVPRKVDLPELTKRVAVELRLVPEGIPDQARGAETVRLILRNLSALTQPTPIGLPALSMPAQNGFRLDDKQRLSPAPNKRLTRIQKRRSESRKLGRFWRRFRTTSCCRRHTFSAINRALGLKIPANTDIRARHTARLPQLLTIWKILPWPIR